MSEIDEQQRRAQELESRRRAIIEKHQLAWQEQEKRWRLRKQAAKKLAREAGEATKIDEPSTWNSREKDRA
jgi:hypothetical protein